MKIRGMGIVVFIMSMALLGSKVLAEAEIPWTRLFVKQFSEQELQRYIKKGVCLITKKTFKFSQLIFSWMAMRPETGYFSFSGRVRDAATQQWGEWHKMMEWGAAIQRSHTTKSDGKSQYFHVRLEMQRSARADGFCIKIEAHDGADLGLLRGCAINIADLAEFKPENSAQLAAQLPSVFIEGVPQQSQMVLPDASARVMCSPTSLSMMVGYLRGQMVDPSACGRSVYDSGLKAYGSWPFNTAHAFELCEGKLLFAVARLNSFTDLHSYLRRDIPVVVSVRGSITGATKPFPHGHLLVVVGFDAQHGQIICHDPAFPSDEQVLVRYAFSEFLRAWERSYHLAYIAKTNSQ